MTKCYVRNSVTGALKFSPHRVKKSLIIVKKNDNQSAVGFINTAKQFLLQIYIIFIKARGTGIGLKYTITVSFTLLLINN